MVIRFRCPQCGRRSKAPAECAGRVGRCPTCQCWVRVPQPSAQSSLGDPSASQASARTPSASFPPASQHAADNSPGATPATPQAASQSARRPAGLTPPRDQPSNYNLSGQTGSQSASGTFPHGIEGAAVGDDTGFGQIHEIGPVRSSSAIDSQSLESSSLEISLTELSSMEFAAEQFRALPSSDNPPSDVAPTALPGLDGSGAQGEAADPESRHQAQSANTKPPIQMETRLSVAEYLEAVKYSALVEPGQLAAFLQDLRKRGFDRHADLIGRELVGANLLTAWQHAMLRKGHRAGFYLNRYKLLRQIGVGGMGVVYLAEHQLLRREVALKVLHPHLAGNRTHIARFFRESQCLAGLDHPNIVRVHDSDQCGQHYYLALEYVAGPNLQDLVSHQGLLSFVTAANYVGQSAAGLAYAHERGLVHRDVKPANLLVTREGFVKVSDLGLARAVGADHALSSVTVDRPDGLLGTADYAAPEQALDATAVNDRADIYSLGATLYFLITGKPPFCEGSMAQRLMAHQIQQAPRLVASRPDTPALLQHLCDQMMAKNPAGRPSARAVQQLLTEWTSSQPDPVAEEFRHSVQAYVPLNRLMGAEETRSNQAAQTDSRSFQ